MHCCRDYVNRGRMCLRDPARKASGKGERVARRDDKAEREVDDGSRFSRDVVNPPQKLGRSQSQEIDDLRKDTVPCCRRAACIYVVYMSGRFNYCINASEFLSRPLLVQVDDCVVPTEYEKSSVNTIRSTRAAGQTAR